MTAPSAATPTGGSLTGKTALITGAAQGIGRAIAEAFARAGASLLLLDLSDTVSETAAVLAAGGATCSALTTDVTDPEAVDRAVREGLAEFGGIDILVNNAGVVRLAPAETAFDFFRDSHEKLFSLSGARVARRTFQNEIEISVFVFNIALRRHNRNNRLLVAGTVFAFLRPNSKQRTVSTEQ